MSLSEQQQALLQALWLPKHADALKIVAACAQPARAAGQNHLERGLRAYRSNGHELAQRALAAAYPVVRELIGADSFDPLARHFWQRHPPERGDLAQWGAAFASFVAALPNLAHEEPYLADVALVEWALHCAATTADPSADTASFGLLAERDPAAITLVLAAGVQCIASSYPVASIVNAHRLGEPALEEAGARLRAGVQETALVWRLGLKPQLRQAAPGEAALVASLQENRSLLDALAAAGELDFNGWLAPAVQSGLLIAARIL